MRKAEEAVTNETQMTNREDKKEASSVQRESGAGAESSDSRNGSGNSATGISNSSSTGLHVVNGDLSAMDSKEGQKTSILEMESSELSANFEDGIDDQNLHENPEKEEAVANIHCG